MNPFSDFIAPTLWFLGAVLMVWERLANIRNKDRSTDGDVAQKVSEAWERLNKPLLAQVDDLRKDLRATQNVLAEYMRGTNILIDALERRNLPVPWHPPKKNGKSEVFISPDN